jgi:hypothetical protein
MTERVLCPRTCLCHYAIEKFSLEKPRVNGHIFALRQKCDSDSLIDIGITIAKCMIAALLFN